MALTDNEKINDTVVDINLDMVQRTRFRINGDSDSIIELNLSDMNIGSRLEEGFNKLEDAMHRIAELPDEDEKLTQELKEIDGQMREYIDFIFDYPVSAVCAKYGTMYDLYNGMFRYEHILNGLTKLYTDNLNTEFNKLRKRIQKHTDKYVSKTKTPAKRKKS